MKTINERDADMIESIDMWLNEIEPKWVEKEHAQLEELRTRLVKEPVSNDLEEEVKRYLCEECSGDDEPAVSEIAHHFAEWQKTKMLKEAVRGEVYKFGEVAYVKERNNAELTKYLSQFNNGDKVKIIVVHETDIR